MARWHSVAIKTIRQANQTRGNGPEIEQVPPCGIEACHQMQIWNYYNSTLSLRQRMHTLKRFPTCVGGFIRNLHQKGIQPKNHGSFFLQRNSGGLQLDLTHAVPQVKSPRGKTRAESASQPAMSNKQANGK